MSNKDYSWLPTVSDTPGIAFTWQQSAEVGNNTLTISFFLKEIDSASAKSGDFELNVADDEIIVVKHKGSKIVQWRLTDELNQGDDPVEWILNRNTTPISLEVSLRKKEDNDWPCLRRQPLLKAEKVDELILSEDTLRENVGYEVPSLPLENNKNDKEKKEDGVDDEIDLDALLDDAADEIDDSLEALMKMRRERESQAYVTEFEALEKAEADNTGKLDSEDEAVVKDAKENIELIKKMREIIVEKRHVRTLPVSIENIIKALQLEIKKIITNSGSETGEENEDFANDEEKSMTGEQLFKKGLEEVKAQTKDSSVNALHFLRLASLKFNHSIATIFLHSMYTQLSAPTKGAFFLLRMALQNEEVDPRANRSVGELINSGSHPFTAIWSLAVFFLQRAAQKGDAESMMRLSNLFFDGMCDVQRGMVVHPDVKKKFMDKTRGDLYLEAALNRGLSEGYLLKASMYLRGENGHTKDTELAKKYFELLKHTDQEAASRLGYIFEPKSTTNEDFDTLRKALERNNIEDVRKILQNFDLTATDNDGRNCLMLCGHYSNSPQVVKVVFEKVEETGGPDLLKSLLTATNNGGWNCLMFCCAYSKSPELVKVVLKKIVETGGSGLLKSLLTATDNNGKNCLMLCAWSTSPEVMKLFAAVLFHFDLFKEQLAKLIEYDKNKLKEEAGIDSSSWTPDAASLAEVKGILEGRVHGKTLNNSTADGKKASGTVIAIKPATIRKYFDFFDYAKTGLMEKSSMCATIVACFPMTSTAAITERVRTTKCKESNKGKLDFNDFCCILNDIL